MSNILATSYYYEPYQNDGIWQQTLEKVGEEIGTKLLEEESSKGDPLAIVILLAKKEAAGEVGSEVFGELGWAIDNRKQLEDNIQTFLEEISDWRTYVSPLDTTVFGGTLDGEVDDGMSWGGSGDGGE